MQRNLLNRVEDLIENRRRFRKARRSQLVEASSIMKRVKNQLRYQEEGVAQIIAQMEKSRCLKKDEKKAFKKDGKVGKT